MHSVRARMCTPHPSRWAARTARTMVVAAARDSKNEDGGKVVREDEETPPAPHAGLVTPQMVLETMQMLESR